MSIDPSARPVLEQAGVSDDQIQSVHAAVQQVKYSAAESYSLLPLMLLGLMSGCILFSAIYLGRYSGHFDPLVYNEYSTGKIVEGPVAGPDPVRMGRRLFMTNCVQCHQPTGQGIPGTYPPLAGSDWITGSEERVIRIVLHGLNGPITVAGQNYNNVMTPFGGILSDEQIAHVLTYIRTNTEWGNDAGEVAPEKVQEVRAATASRPATQAWTAEEILAIP